MNTPSIFHYQNPRQFLMDYLSARQKQESDFSIRAWARELKVWSHTQLVMLLNGKRPLRLKHVPTFAENLKLPSSERLYFQALIQYDSAATPEEKELTALWLAELNPGKKFKTKEMDEFRVVSHWTYTAILMMTELKDFGGTSQEISRILKGRITPIEAQASLQRLIDLGLVIRDVSGKLHATYDQLTTRDDIANEGARKYHRSTLEAAIQAIEEVPLNKREFQSFTIAVKKNKVQLAKEMIRRFKAQFVTAVAAEGDGEDIFQMNINFFQLTESPVRTDRTEDEGVESIKTQKKKDDLCLNDSCKA